MQHLIPIVCHTPPFPISIRPPPLALPPPTLLDVVKSRFQALLPADRLAAGYRFTLPSLAAIAAAEGPAALYKGFVPKALRLGLGQTIGLMVFQRSMKVLGCEEGAAE